MSITHVFTCDYCCCESVLETFSEAKRNGWVFDTDNCYCEHCAEMLGGKDKEEDDE